MNPHTVNICAPANPAPHFLNIDKMHALPVADDDEGIALPVHPLPRTGTVLVMGCQPRIRMAALFYALFR